MGPICNYPAQDIPIEEIINYYSVTLGNHQLLLRYIRSVKLSIDEQRNSRLATLGLEPHINIHIYKSLKQNKRARGRERVCYEHMLAHVSVSCDAIHSTSFFLNQNLYFTRTGASCVEQKCS